MYIIFKNVFTLRAAVARAPKMHDSRNLFQVDQKQKERQREGFARALAISFYSFYERLVYVWRTMVDDTNRAQLWHTPCVSTSSIYPRNILLYFDIYMRLYTAHVRRLYIISWNIKDFNNNKKVKKNTLRCTYEKLLLNILREVEKIKTPAFMKINK